VQAAQLLLLIAQFRRFASHDELGEVTLVAKLVGQHFKGLRGLHALILQGLDGLFRARRVAHLPRYKWLGYALLTVIRLSLLGCAVHPNLLAL